MVVEGEIRSLDNILNMFSGKKHKLNDKSWNVICPAHNDHEPSLTITLNSNRILIDCKAGCTREAILEAKGLTIADLFLGDKPTPKRKTIATYSYTDESGNLLYQILRYEPKGFAQRRPDGNGGYIWNVEGVDKVIYRLPEVTQAIKQDETIYITEGEQDTDALWGIGLIATCNPGGAGKWRPEYSHQLSGANLAILPDADGVGIKHALDVANSTNAEAKSVRLLEPFTDAKDVSEWIKQGHTREELETLVNDTPYYTPNVHNIPNSNISIRVQELNEFSENVATGGLSGGLSVDDSRARGDLSIPFYAFLSENPEWHLKREVARLLDVSHLDDAFLKLIQRGRKSGRLEVSPNGDRIRGINKRWQDFEVELEVLDRPLLDLKLPFGAEQLLQIPEKTQIVVAGDGGAGKTHWGYHLADLNLDKLPIRHFVVEDGDQRMAKMLEDFPLLLEAFKAKDGRYHLINPSKGDGLVVPENLDPNGINIWDYLRVPDRKDWYLGVQKEMVKCNEALDTGAVVVMIQKKRGERVGYGKDFSLMQCSIYFSLHIDREARQSPNDYGHKECHITIEKARDFASKQNPLMMACGYRTAPLHGKLVPDMKGWIMKENFENK